MGVVSSNLFDASRPNLGMMHIIFFGQKDGLHHPPNAFGLGGAHHPFVQNNLMCRVRQQDEDTLLLHPNKFGLSGTHSSLVAKIFGPCPYTPKFYPGSPPDHSAYCNRVKLSPSSSVPKEGLALVPTMERAKQLIGLGLRRRPGQGPTL